MFPGGEYPGVRHDRSISFCATLRRLAGIWWLRGASGCKPLPIVQMPNVLPFCTDATARPIVSQQTMKVTRPVQ